MQTGDLYEHNDKKVKKAIENNEQVSMGVDINSILDTINLHEINHPNDAATVLALVKQEIMLYLGKIKIEDESKKKD